jgi:hypothetical protein
LGRRGRLRDARRAANGPFWSSNLSTKLLGDATPIDQYQQIKNGDNSQPWADVPYLADALESKSSEVGRLAVVDYYLKTKFSTYGEGPGNAVRWGMCGTDLKKFNIWQPFSIEKSAGADGTASVLRPGRIRWPRRHRGCLVRH